jgi:hypothetical protein
MMKSFYSLFIFLLIVSAGHSQDKKFKVHTVAFYNVENLFDTKNDPKINDEEWLETGAQHWTDEKYKKKLVNLARVISQLGTAENPNSPTILGVAEIENRAVLEDLIKEPLLADKGYGIVHYDSPDRRGIDVGLLYQKKYFKPTSSKNIPLIIYNKDKARTVTKETNKEKEAAAKSGDADELAGVTINVDYTGRVFTRDQLLVTGMLEGEEISFIVNHWPSRSGGEKRSSPFREAAGALNRKIIDSLYKINPNAKVITMGDLNDGPYNNSLKKSLGAKAHKEETKPGDVFNPMEEMSAKGMGTLAYRDAWDIFDQMIMTEPLIRKDYTSLRFWKAGIFNKTFVTQPTGQYKGYPLRNSNGNVGFSDHFPVYLYLIKQM